MSALPVRNKSSLRSLSECGRLLTGGTPSRNRSEFWGGDIPWISAKSLKQFDVFDSEDRLTEAGTSDSTTLVPEDTILFVVRGMSLANEFRVGVTRRQVAFNQDLRALLPAKDIDARYLGRFLQAEQTTILGLADEASHGTKRLTSDRLAALRVPVPPPPEQRRIAEVLDRAEALRAKRRAALARLDELTQAIFTEMFGDPKPNPKRWPVLPMRELFSASPIFGSMIPPAADKRTWLSLRVGNIQDWKLDLTDSKFIELPSDAVERHSVQDGDLLLARAIQ